MTLVDKGSALRPLQRWRVESTAAFAGHAAPSGVGGPTEDRVVVEEPLEIRVCGETVAVTMRTPGEDVRLVLGFLYAEGVIDSLADVGTVAPCGRPGVEGYGNIVDVLPGPGVSLDLERASGAVRRGTLTTAACGVCGRRTIADLLQRCGVAGPGPVVSARWVDRAFGQLRAAQGLFSLTGGCHAVAAFDAGGDLLAASEDIGRHNAADKVLGALLQRGLVGAAATAEATARPAVGSTARPSLWAVSGRASFEIVQKAARAGVRIVASVSAPSTLAIDLAAACGVTLLGFVREGAFNIYTHGERIDQG